MVQVTQSSIDEIKTLINQSTQIEDPQPAADTHLEDDQNINEDDQNTNEDPQPRGDINEDDTEVTSEQDDPEQDDSEQDDSEQVDEYAFPSDIAALAQAIDVAPEDLYSINIKMADGHPDVKLGDLKDQYNDTLRKNESLEATIAEQKDQLNNVSEGTNVQVQASQKKLQLMGQLQSIQAEYQSTDWNSMEASNPGEAALLRQKFQDAFSANQGQMSQVSAYEDDQKKKYLHNSATKVMEFIPEWSDAEVRVKGTADIEHLLIDEGMNKSQVGNVTDPVAIKLLNELVNLRAQVKSAKKTVEQVRKAPKVLRGKARITSNKGSNTTALVERAQKSHSRVDETAAIKSILGLK